MDEITKPEIKKETLEEETLSPEISSKPKPVARVVRSAKPLVEGINSPIINSVSSVKPKADLTEAEKQLINSPIGPVVAQKTETRKPLSDFMPPQEPKNKRVLWISLVGLMLIALAWGAFMWYNNQDTFGKLQPLPIKKKKISNSVDSQTTSSSSSPQTNIGVLPATSTPATTKTPTGQTENQLKVKTTPTGFLNVRATASTSGKLLTKVYPGDILTYKSEKNKWYEVVLQDGTIGWVTGQYVEKVVVK